MPKRDRKLNPDGTKRVYGPEYYRVSSMDCCVCGSTGWWAHHVKSVNRGGEDMGNLAPLCFKHHTQGHSIGWLTFEARHDIILEDIAKEVGRGE